MEGSPVIKEGTTRVSGCPFRVRGRRLERTDGPVIGQRLRQEACNCHSLCLCEFQAACYATKAGCVLHRRWCGHHATAAQAQQNATRWWSRRHQLSVVTLQTSTNTTVTTVAGRENGSITVTVINKSNQIISNQIRKGKQNSPGTPSHPLRLPL